MKWLSFLLYGMVPFCTNTGIEVLLKRKFVLNRGWVSESSGNPRTHFSRNEDNTMFEITISAKWDWKQIGQLVSSSLSTPSRMQMLVAKPDFNAPVCDASLPTFLLQSAP